MKWIDVNGASLRYRRDGRGGADPLVLVHEMGGAIESWDHVLPALVDDFDVIRYDQRGGGWSEKAKGRLSVETAADDLAALLDALGVSKPARVVGVAVGAGVSIKFASKYPERVARLVLSSPATGVAEDRRQATEERADHTERQGMRAVAEATMATAYPEMLREGERFPAMRGRWLANDPESYAATTRMLADMALEGDFARIECPTLVVGNEHDALRPPETAKKVADAIPGAEFEMLPSGHFMPTQTPELFVRHVVPFLRGS